MPASARYWSRGIVGWLAEWVVAALVGAGLLGLSDLLVAPWPTPFEGHGAAFAKMAADPFAFAGEFPQRMLWPFGAWLAGHVGIDPPGFTRVCNGLLLAVVFWFARRRAGNAVDALCVTAAIAASGAVLVYKRMACYSDTLNLVLLVLLVHFAARGVVFWVLVWLSALSHEMVFFFAPWLVYVRCQNGGRLGREGLALGAVLAAYLLFRLPMQSAYGIAYYFEKNFWVPWGMPALWALWLLVVLAEFGPLLVLVVCAWGRRELQRQDTLGGRWGPWLYVAGMLPMMMLAYDVMRFATFVFLPVVLGGVAVVRTRGGRWLLLALVAAAAASYAWLHPLPEQQGGHHFTLVAAEAFAEERRTLLVSRTPGDAVTFTIDLFRATAPIWLGAAAAAIAIAAAGLLLARYAPGTASSAGSEPRTRQSASP